MSTRSVRIFLSSTFRDFGEERDLLVRKVFPALRIRLKDRFVELVDVDLRWGITVEEAERGEVLPICLAEIDRSRPYFIGMLGERYGWIPPHEGYAPGLLERQPWLKKHQGGKSVTELEILHGVLKNKRMKSRAFFYFRSPAYARSKGGHYVPDNTDDRQRQLDLKRRIKASGYSVTGYRDPEALAKRMERDLWKLLDAEFPASDVPDAFEREAMRHEAYAAPRRRLYLGADEYIDGLNALIKKNANRILITGQSGGGKSALLANALENHHGSKTHLLEHYLGSSSDAADSAALVRRVIEYIRRVTGNTDPVAADTEELFDSIPKWLAVASAFAKKNKTHWIFVFDSLNNLNGYRDLKWFPDYLPEHIQIVASCLEGEVKVALETKGTWDSLVVEPLESKGQRQLLTEYLKRFNKSLSADLLNQALGHPLANNPLWLKTLAEELRLFGSHEELSNRLNTLLGPPQGKEMNEPPTVDDLFEHVLQRIEGDQGRKLVRNALSAIWASRAGLSETELLEILAPHSITTGKAKKANKLPPAQWAPVRNALDEMLLESGGRIIFGHDYMKIAVKNRYLSTDRNVLSARETVRRLFETKPVIRRTVEELPWQLLQLGKRKLLEKYLIRPEVFLEIGNSKPADLNRYWDILGQDRIAKSYGRPYENSKSQWNLLYPLFGMRLAKFMLDNGIFVEFTNELFSEVIQNKPIEVDSTNFQLFRLDFCDFLLHMGDSRAASLASAATLWARRYLTAGHVNRIRAEATNNRCLAAGGNWTEAVERQQTLVNELLLSSSISSSELLVDQVIVFAHLLGGYWIERAYPYVSRVLEITTVKLGPDHPSVLECQDLFVRILIAQKDYSQAINVALGVIFSGYRVFGESHPFTAMAIGKLGIAQLHLGDIESAVASLETATEKLIARFSNEHEYATAFMGSLADAYRQLGKDKDAERITKLLNVPLISRIFNQ